MREYCACHCIRLDFLHPPIQCGTVTPAAGGLVGHSHLSACQVLALAVALSVSVGALALSGSVPGGHRDRK